MLLARCLPDHTNSLVILLELGLFVFFIFKVCTESPKALSILMSKKLLGIRHIQGLMMCWGKVLISLLDLVVFLDYFFFEYLNLFQMVLNDFVFFFQLLKNGKSVIRRVCHNVLEFPCWNLNNYWFVRILIIFLIPHFF